MSDSLRRMVEPLQRKLRMLAGRAVIRLMSDAVTAQVEGLADEVRDGAEVFQQYGFRSMPLPGAEGVMLSLGGSRDHTVVLCVNDRRYHATVLASGECVMEDHLGKAVHFKLDGSIEVTAATKVRFDAPLVESNGDIRDHCDGTGITMAQMRSIFNEHSHPDSHGGNTGKPLQEM
ncbi:MAG: phage baseplate assembly protein V [Janthinobacterium svalbardensis]